MSMYNAIDRLFESEALKEADRESRFARLEDSIKRNRARKLNESERDIKSDVIAAVEDGFLSWENVARAALGYLSDDDIYDLIKVYEWGIADDEELDNDSDIADPDDEI